MANFDANNINEIDCGEFTVENTTGSTQELITRKLIGNNSTVIEWEDIDTQTILDSETIILELPASEVWEVSYEASGEDDVAYLYNLCIVDACIIKTVNDLLCEACCNECADICVDVRKAQTYVTITLAYDVLQDMLDINFSRTPEPWHSSLSIEVNDVMSIYDLIQKITELCSCNPC